MCGKQQYSLAELLRHRLGLVHEDDDPLRDVDGGEAGPRGGRPGPVGVGANALLQALAKVQGLGVEQPALVLFF